ncbi:MAG: hypothetical protein K0Q60_4971 [Microvirga sp.]|nr:hypothetical protein [Microvirga sp.]
MRSQIGEFRFRLIDLFLMRLVAAAIGAVLTTASLSATANASQGDSPLVGTWASVDPGDRSTQQITIRQLGEAFALVWEESYWSICKGRPGLMEGTGRLRPDGGQALVMEREVLCFEPPEVVIRDTATFELRGDDVLVATAGNGAFRNQEMTRVNVEPAASDGDLRFKATALEREAEAAAPDSKDQKRKLVVLSSQELAFEMPHMMDLRRTVAELEEEVARLSRMVRTLYEGLRPGEPRP